MAIPKRTIDEEITRLTFDRDLRVTYVEGPFDRAVIVGFLDAHEIMDAEVYDISCIAVTVRSGGNRARVIELSQKLSMGLPNDVDNVRCIADSDFDCLSNTYLANRFLLYTDFTSMDLYFFRRSSVQLIVRVLFRKTYKAIYYDSLVGCLQTAFSLRMAVKALSLEAGFTNLDASCSFRNGRLSLDEDDVLDRLLVNNGLGGRVPAVKREARKAKKTFHTDPRMQIHSKDLLKLLSFLGRELRARKDSRTLTVIQDSLVIATDLQSIEKFGLFGKILAWAK